MGFFDAFISAGGMSKGSLVGDAMNKVRGGLAGLVGDEGIATALKQDSIKQATEGPMMDKKDESIWDKFKGGFTDDKGLFQGGKEGRFLGRFKDTMEGQIPQRQARDFARQFNPEDKDQVMELQEKMNKLGAQLEVDGIMGPKTLGALRSLQGGGAPTDVYSPLHAPQGANTAALPAQQAPPQQSFLGNIGSAIGGLFGSGQNNQLGSHQMGPVPYSQDQIQGPFKNDPYGYGTRSQGGQFGGGGW